MYAVNNNLKTPSSELKKVSEKKKLHYQISSPVGDLLAYNLSMRDWRKNFFSINNLESIIPIGHPIEIDEKLSYGDFFKIEHQVYMDVKGRHSNAMLVFDLFHRDNSSEIEPKPSLGIRDGFIVQFYHIKAKAIPRSGRKRRLSP